MTQEYSSSCPCKTCDHDAICSRNRIWTGCAKYKDYLHKRWQWVNHRVIRNWHYLRRIAKTWEGSKGEASQE